MENLSSSEKSKKFFFNKYKFLLVFSTWITKISSLVLLYPKSTGKNEDLLKFWGYYELVLLFLILIIPLEFISYWTINYMCGKILKIILFGFDFILYTLNMIYNRHDYYFSYVLYLISVSSYYISCLLLLYFIFDELNKSCIKEEKNEAKELLTLEKNAE